MEMKIASGNYIAQEKGKKNEVLDFSYVAKPLRLDYFDFLAYEGDYITKVTTGACHTIFLSKFGKVFVCGFNFNGEIGKFSYRNSKYSNNNRPWKGY